MERNSIFTPPAFTGTGFRQNHQIRSLKTNSYPILPSHPAASVSLVTARGSNFSRSNLTSQRRKHLRKCYDLVQISIQRREPILAGRFLRVILGAHEWSTNELFHLCLLLLSLSESGEEEREGGGKVKFLQMLDLESSNVFKATHVTPALIEEYMATGRLKEAIELLEERVNVHPYKSQPVLHCLLGMMYVFIGVSTLVDQNEAEEGVELRKLDRTTRNKARLCFETTLQVSENWVRSETAKRQRIWGVRKRESNPDRRKMGKSESLWGLNPVDEEWQVEEHPDLTKVRRRLEGQLDEDEETDGEGESSASGSVYSLSPTPSEEERGRTRTRSHPTPQTPPEQQEIEEPTPKYGPRLWSQYWSEVEGIWTPTLPPSVLIAEQFLSLLNPHFSQRGQEGGRKRKLGKSFTAEQEEDPEEAELRLRQILFEEDHQAEDRRRGREDRSRGKLKRSKREDQDGRRREKKRRLELF